MSVLDPWYLGLSDHQRDALAECSRHGRLYRFGYWYGADASHRKYREGTIKALVRLNLMQHGMRRLRHFHVSLTGLGRLFAESKAQ